MIYQNLLPMYQRYWHPDQDLELETVLRFMVENFRLDRTQNPFQEGCDEHRQFAAALQDYQRNRFKRYLDLPDVPIVRLPSKRRMAQPTLKIQYDTLHDITMRLSNSLIFVGSVLYYCREIVEIDKEFLLIVENADDQRFKCWYKNDAIDLRTIEPQYIRHQASPGFLCRSPSRQQRQGILFDNVYCRCVGGGGTVRFENIRSLIDGVTTEIYPWTPTYLDLMLRLRALPALRLSKDVALYTKRKGPLMAEYRGRLLGEVKDNTVLVDKDDFTRPWIVNAARMVGLEVDSNA